MPISSKLLWEDKHTPTHTKIQYDAMNPQFLKEESRLGMQQAVHAISTSTIHPVIGLNFKNE